MKKVLSKSLLVLGLLGASGLAFATQDAGGPGGADVWQVYAFSNAKAVSETFRAINNFVASGVFLSLFSFIAMLGLFAVLFTGGFGPGGAKKFINYIVATLFISYMFTGFGGGRLVVKVEVQDTITGTWVAPVEVPFIVGVPAAVISTAGHEITRQIEASFFLPDEFKLANGAPYNLAASLLNDATKAKIADAKLSRSMAYYISDCFTSGVAAGALEATTLLTSTDFLKDIAYLNQAMMVNTELGAPGGGTPTPGGAPGASMELVNCVDAYARILARVEQGGEAADYFTEASAWHGTAALDVLNTAADAVGSALSGGALSGASMVKQAAVLSTFTGSYSKVAAATGNSDFLSAVAIEQAKAAQVNSWIVGAEMFNRTMGYIYSILQVFVYATAPLVFMAILIPGVGGSLAKSFAQILVWLALWQPLLAIVNFVVLSMQLPDLQNMMAAGGEGYGMTLSTIGLVSEKTANMRAAAAVVGMMVPVLAWGMVKGAIDMTKFVSTAAGEQFASSAANTMATGNYSLNQASMDSFTANKSSISQTSAPGGGMTVTDGIMSHKNDFGGSQNQIMGASAALSGSAGLDTSRQSVLGAGTTLNATSNHAVSGGTQAGASNTGGTSTQGGQTISGVSNTSGSAGVGGRGALSAGGSRPGVTGTAVPPGDINHVAVDGTAAAPNAPGGTTTLPGAPAGGAAAAAGGAAAAGAAGGAAAAGAATGKNAATLTTPAAATPAAAAKAGLATPAQKQKSSLTANQARRAGFRVPGTLTGHVDAGLQRGHVSAVQDMHSQSGMNGSNGSLGRTGSDVYSAGTGYGRTETANTQQAASSREGLQAQAVAGPEARAAADRQVANTARAGDPFTGRSYRAAAGTALHEQFYGTGSSDLDKADAAVNTNTLAAAQQKLEADVQKRNDQHDAERAKQESEAAAKKAKAESEAQSMIGAGAGLISGAQAEANKGVLARTGEDFKSILNGNTPAGLESVAEHVKNMAPDDLEQFKNDVAGMKPDSPADAAAKAKAAGQSVVSKFRGS